MVKHFSKGAVFFDEGVLVIQTSNYLIMRTHYNIEIEEKEDGKLIVKAEKAKFDISIHKGAVPIDLITESSIEEYKEWPWSRTKKKRSKQVVEYKQRTPVTYHAVNWVIQS